MASRLSADGDDRPIVVNETIQTSAKLACLQNRMTMTAVNNHSNQSGALTAIISHAFERETDMDEILMIAIWTMIGLALITLPLATVSLG